jgi:hypothetical protein
MTFVDWFHSFILLCFKIVRILLRKMRRSSTYGETSCFNAFATQMASPLRDAWGILLHGLRMSVNHFVGCFAHFVCNIAGRKQAGFSSLVILY